MFFFRSLWLKAVSCSNLHNSVEPHSLLGRQCNIEEEQGEIDEVSLYHTQMDVWEMNMIKSDHHSIQDIQDCLNERIVCLELSQSTTLPINTGAPSMLGEMDLSAADDDIETCL